MSMSQGRGRIGSVSVYEISRAQMVEFARAGYLYAIIDATDLRSVPPKMNGLGQERALSLFLGGPRESHYAFAPFVAKADETLLAWIEAELVDQPWGIFAISNAPFLALFEHLRSQLIVMLADGRQWNYRFYDPRVLERHLLRGQAGTLFGPVRSYVVPSRPQLAGKAFVLDTSDVETSTPKR